MHDFMAATLYLISSNLTFKKRRELSLRRETILREWGGIWWSQEPLTFAMLHFRKTMSVHLNPLRSLVQFKSLSGSVNSRIETMGGEGERGDEEAIGLPR